MCLKHAGNYRMLTHPSDPRLSAGTTTVISCQPKLYQAQEMKCGMLNKRTFLLQLMSAHINPRISNRTTKIIELVLPSAT